MSQFSIKTNYLIMPFAIKTKQKNKVQGSLEHYDSRHFIRLPPRLGEAFSSMIQNEKNKREEKKKKE
jgi:hypothetical protein